MPNNAILASDTGLPKLTRRALLAAAATTPLVALPVAASGADGSEIKALTIVLADHTGLSLDDLACWFKGLSPDTLRRIQENIHAAPGKKWTYDQTFAAVVAINTGEIFQGRMKAKNPTLPYALRQIALKGNRAALKANLSYFKDIEDYDGVLMEFA